MKLSEYSINRFNSTLAHWEVSKSYAEPMFNYFIYAYPPGSFFASFLANDCLGAIGHSHPSNTIVSLKALSGWLVNTNSRGSIWGSYDICKQWLESDEGYRRSTLEKLRLIYPHEEEMWMTLKGEKTAKILLY